MRFCLACVAALTTLSVFGESRPSVDVHDLALVPAVRSFRIGDKPLPSEGYRIRIGADGKASVEAADEAGRFYAGVTLRQLGDVKGPLEIEDWPEYAWRGALVDESRHFFGEKAMKRIIEWMSYYKMNVLHWHLTDSQGWRIESELYPELNKAGATRPRPDYCKWNVDYEVGPTPCEFYTKAQIRDIVKFAAERHVTIMPEIDFPGHSRAFNFAFPELYCLGKQAFIRKLLWDDTHRHTEVICLGNDKVIEMCENLIAEAVDLFPCKVIHIGGDECVTNTWGQCAKCQARIRNEQLGDERGLQRWFIRRMAAAAAKKGRRIAGWDEMMSADPPKDAIMQNWHAQALGVKAAAAGFDVIMSPNVDTYLDYQQGIPDDSHTYPGFATDTYLPWWRVLAFDPMKGVDPKYRARVKGAEACNWSNCTPTEEELLWKMWPRQCAFAEAVWTAAKRPDAKSFARRVKPHLAKMLQDGIVSAPLLEPAKIIFDTDMYTDFDDAGALALLHAMADEGWCEILATISCTRGNASVAACEVINGFYGRGDIPVGCAMTGPDRKDDAHFGTYGHLLKSYPNAFKYADSSQAPAALDVYRRVLSAQPDKSVTLCSVGFLNNVAELLEKEPELFARKIKVWYVMGCTPNGREYNIYRDVPAAKTALAKCPVPIVYADFDYGKRVLTGLPLTQGKDGANPVKDVYRRRLGGAAEGHPSWDLTAVLAAVRGVGFFAKAERGRYEIVDDKGTSVWHPDPNGRDCRLAEDLPYKRVGEILDSWMMREPKAK